MTTDTIDSPRPPGKLVGKTGSEFVWLDSRCVGCAKCERGCPVGAIALKRSKKPIKRLSPCSAACPAGIDVPRYNRAIAAGRFAEAVAVIRERLPLPGVCGYVCLHPCELKCTRSDINGNVAIRALKRFAVANDNGDWKKGVRTAASTGKRIAVIGGGPAGLSTAYYLARKGYGASVFTSSDSLGGKMLESIPEYDLPREVLVKDIAEMVRSGIDVHTGVAVDQPESLFDQGYDGVVVATGLQGSKFPQVLPLGAVDKALAPDEVDYGAALGTVVVLGNGGRAYETALRALKAGASEAHIVASGPSVEQEADLWQVDQALNAGVIVHQWRTFVRVLEPAGGRIGVEYFKARAYGFDKDRALEFDVIPETASVIAADTVINAAQANPDNRLSCSVRQGRAVFVAGDAVSELRSVINSVAAGRWTASMIDKYFGGDGDISEALAPPEKPPRVLENPAVRAKADLPTYLASGNIEKEATLVQKAAVKEAQRCLSCDACYLVNSYAVDTGRCTYCGRCVENCYRGAISAGYGYKASAEQKKEAEEGAEKRDRLYGYIIGFLVLGLAAIITAVVIGRLVASLQ